MKRILFLLILMCLQSNTAEMGPNPFSDYVRNGNYDKVVAISEENFQWSYNHFLSKYNETGDKSNIRFFTQTKLKSVEESKKYDYLVNRIDLRVAEKYFAQSL